MAEARSSRCCLCVALKHCPALMLYGFTLQRQVVASERRGGRTGVEEGEMKGPCGARGAVNRRLIRHIPSVDICALLNKAFDTGATAAD